MLITVTASGNEDEQALAGILRRYGGTKVGRVWELDVDDADAEEVADLLEAARYETDYDSPEASNRMSMGPWGSGKQESRKLNKAPRMPKQSFGSRE